MSKGRALSVAILIVSLNTLSAVAEPKPSDNGNPLVSSDKWKLMPITMTWNDAKANAPSGYRLPKRWEILKAFDENTIGSINAQVWTDNCLSDLKCWYVILSNAEGYRVSKSKTNDPKNQQQILYILDDSAGQ